MRYFNPETMTEAIPGLHDVTEAKALPNDHWFFTSTEIPEGKLLSVGDDDEPVLVDAVEHSEEK